MAWIDDLSILSQKPPPWLVDGVLPEGAVCALVGESGLGKTFIALDVAFSVASGRDWRGYATRQRPVAYIIAEGLGGMSLRVAAWRAQNAVLAHETPIGVHFWNDAVQLASESAVRAFCVELRGLPVSPGLVVVDTLARCFIGKDENHSRDMGEFVRGVDVLRSTGAAVLVVHHTGHLKTRERGSTALRAAVDTLIIVERSGPGGIALRCEKQREAEAFDPMGLKLVNVELDEGSSAVVENADLNLDVAESQTYVKALDLLGQAERGLTFSDWRRVVGMPETSFRRFIQRVTTTGKVVKNGQLYYRSENGKAEV